MKNIFATTFIVLSITICYNINPTIAQSDSRLEPFLGSWALTLPHNGFADAGWLEVKQKEGYIDANLLWYGGSVTPVDHAYLHGEDLVITISRKRKVKDRDLLITSRIELHAEGDELYGTRYMPAPAGNGVRVASFTGIKLPSAPTPPLLSKLNFGEAIQLLDPNSLKGWRLIKPKATNGWSVKDGVLTNDPVQNDPNHHIHYGNLRTEQKFEDFRLTLEVNIPKGSNSGIYLRGIYEIQVYDSYGKDLDSHHMGALYSRITPSISAEKPAGEWQTFDITLANRHITVILNGKTIIDNEFVGGCTGGALTSNEFVAGPIYLQGDHGKVKYRNIVLTPVVD